MLSSFSKLLLEQGEGELVCQAVSLLVLYLCKGCWQPPFSSLHMETWECHAGSSWTSITSALKPQARPCQRFSWEAPQDSCPTSRKLANQGFVGIVFHTAVYVARNSLEQSWQEEEEANCHLATCVGCPPIPDPSCGTPRKLCTAAMNTAPR